MKNLATKNTTDFTVLENGQAFISQRKAAELCGVGQSTIRDFFHSNNIDVNQGVSAENLEKPITHYARKGRAEAVQTLILFAKAGAKAYIYHQAGYTLRAQTLPEVIPEPTKGSVLLSLWEAERDLGLAKLHAQHKIDMEDIAQRQKALEQREYVLINGMKVKADMTASKVSLPVVTITTVVAGTQVRPAEANRILSVLGYLEPNKGTGSPWAVTTKAVNYGKNMKGSKSAFGTEPRWYEGTDLIDKILDYLKD